MPIDNQPNEMTHVSLTPLPCYRYGKSQDDIPKKNPPFEEDFSAVVKKKSRSKKPRHKFSL